MKNPKNNNHKLNLKKVNLLLKVESNQLLSMEKNLQEKKPLQEEKKYLINLEWILEWVKSQKRQKMNLLKIYLTN